MTTLIEFLTARVEEDRALAQGAIDDVNGEDCWFDTGNAHIADHYQRHSPDRVFREVAAKRALLKDHEDQHECTSHSAYAFPYVGCDVLRQLADVYADHPEYDSAWSWIDDDSFDDVGK